MKRAVASACAALAVATGLAAQEPRPDEDFKATGSRRAHAHWIELLDASGKTIDPGDADAPPFSTTKTCGKCHDVAAIEHGWHFAAAGSDTDAGRPGEPWLWTDPRTGTQLPLSYRKWAGTFDPRELGVDGFRFVLEFGRHLPGGASSYAGADATQGRFRLSGALDVDCMVCHDRNASWSHERWSKAIDAQDFAWASGKALGLLHADGDVKSLPDSHDATTPDGKAKLPRTRYDRARFDPDGKVFFDVVRVPSNEACWTCHSARAVGDGAEPRWLHDDDVHLRAGMRCADCHRNDLAHHLVRGHEGERHPSGASIASFSCRGCHLDESDGHGNVVAAGGRLGAPAAEHRGLPAVHLEKLSCTACHSGPRSAAMQRRVQTSLAHALGIPSQTRGDDDLPRIVEPVLARDDDGVVRPHRMAWPSFWAWSKDGALTPITPDAAFATVRRALRVRKDLVAELGAGDEARAKIAAGLAAFATQRSDATPVFVSGGRAWRLGADGKQLVSFEHSAAKPVSWSIAHDVRPARDALGARGCTECHAGDAPFVHARVAAIGVVPDADPPASSGVERLQLDATLVAAWEKSFAGRDWFKLLVVVAIGVVTIVLLAHALRALAAIGKRSPPA
ncbi:MAG: hypothetical protein HZB39_08760 [Planctomycetes bacterium]|nr:hypothetical protein [Planctomycetota bacterium]